MPDIAPYPDRIADESPGLSGLRVIGVELAVKRRDGLGNIWDEEELEMFHCTHTIQDVEGPRGRAGSMANPPGRASFRVTLHTSQGDLTAYIPATNRYGTPVSGVGHQL